MRMSLLAAVVILLPSLGCASSPSYRGESAELCNTPGRKALIDEITARGGLVLTEEGKKWDDSVEANVKASMGAPLSEVVLPQDKFSVQEAEKARLIFPEAQISTPLSLEEFVATQSAQSADDSSAE